MWKYKAKDLKKKCLKILYVKSDEDEKFLGLISRNLLL